jgi:hypothetical protein
MVLTRRQNRATRIVYTRLGYEGCEGSCWTMARETSKVFGVLLQEKRRTSRNIRGIGTNFSLCY